jgi:hypothetical protein
LPKFFICPVSKNITDAVINFCKTHDTPVALIPSRRQVEWDGGYVNNWTTESFAQYAAWLPLQRDHGGPGQGYKDDDGYQSLEHDCKYFDLIHVDPWKKYPSYSDGLKWTIDIINFCYQRNRHLWYEIATEEALRPFTAMELKQLIENLRQHLKPEIFKQIKYAVVQSGTSLKENINTGAYSEYKLTEMLKVLKPYGLLSKEHNGDYLGGPLVQAKMKAGLDAINIGPEFGLVETQTYLDAIKESSTQPDFFLTLFWQLCYDSKRWTRWVDKDFDPLKNHTKLIQICGHYVFSHPVFVNKIKNSFKDIDKTIQTNIIKRLETYYYE